MPQFPFNPAQHEYRKTFEQLPAGWYPAVISGSEIVPTSKGDGFRLVLEYTIIDGAAKGRIVGKQGHNIQNPNPQTVEIAMSEIKTISACVGKYAPIQQSEELHNIPLQIRLIAAKDSDFNEVKGWKDINGNDPGKGGQGAPVQHQQQPPQGFAAPPAQQPYGAPPPQQQYAPPAQAQYAPPAPAQPPTYAQPPQPQYAPQPPAPQGGAPAWAAPVAAPPAQQYAPAPQQAAAPQAPAWTPGAAPQAPAWAAPVQG